MPGVRDVEDDDRGGFALQDRRRLAHVTGDQRPMTSAHEASGDEGRDVVAVGEDQNAGAMGSG